MFRNFNFVFSFIWSQDPNLERNWTRRTFTVTNSSRFVTVWCTLSGNPFPRDQKMILTKNVIYDINFMLTEGYC